MEWISVYNRLPPPLLCVLASDGFKIFIAFRKPELEYEECWEICPEQDCKCSNSTGAITHWMELPNPPKKGEK